MLCKEQFGIFPLHIVNAQLIIALNCVVVVQDVEKAFWPGKHEPGHGVSWTVHIQVLLKLELL